jgi:cyclopropane fatty-acyl-phospholipid synthase-like methyltransferase
VVNGFVVEHSVNSVIEFGSGDGNQLAMMNYPSYIGLDVSKSAIKLCKHRFASDGSKSFFLYDSSCFVDNHSMFVADVALSLDVIFHLTEDDVYESYMRHLFSSSRRFVVVYSSDQDTSPDRIACVRHRKFTSWVAAKMPEWVLFEKRVNPMKYPEQRDGSFSDFFFYRRSDSQ